MLFVSCSNQGTDIFTFTSSSIHNINVVDQDVQVFSLEDYTGSNFNSIIESFNSIMMDYKYSDSIEDSGGCDADHNKIIVLHTDSKQIFFKHLCAQIIKERFSDNGV
jgi:hypothetical protein